MISFIQLNICYPIEIIMKRLFLLIATCFSLAASSQKTYEDSLRTYLQNYVQKHEVVEGLNKKNMQFYPVNKAYRVTGKFTPATSSVWISFKTSGNQNQVYRVYGTVSFQLASKTYKLNLYQSQDLLSNPQYKNYLFLPFTDSTSGIETYDGGRYLDFSITDIQNNQVVLDFNKAYNPYCAYVSGVYNCPIPPKENALAVAIKAGEQNFKAAKKGK